jgi:hypothetical protein
MSNKKWHFSWVMVRPFFPKKRRLKNSPTFRFSEMEDAGNT